MEESSPFTKDIEELISHFNVRKDPLVRYIKKNFKEDIHYIIMNNAKRCLNKGSGGYNRCDYFLRIDTFNLVRNSFKLKHRYIGVVGNCQMVNVIMSLETQTIGFIHNCFHGVVKVEREKIINPYRVDLYFQDYRLIVECDELGHSDRDPEEEKKREEFLLEKEMILLRYNPNIENFDLSIVLREINRILLSSSTTDRQSRVIRI